jgi:chromate transporter
MLASPAPAELKTDEAEPVPLHLAYRVCEDIARTHYENFPVASRFIPAERRISLAAIYAFARQADDIADAAAPSDDRLRALDAIEDAFLRALDGDPRGPVLTALADTVERHGLPTEPFLDLLGAVNVIPGPNSTEMAIHVGLLAGWRGFLVAGVCFILPAVAIVTVLAWLYVEFSTLPQASGILRGVKPAVIAVVVQALWRLGRDSLKTPLLAVLAVLSVGLSVLGVHELLVLLVGGIVAWAGWWIAERRNRGTPAVCLGVLPIAFANAAGGAVVPVSLLGVFLFFLKVGTVLFGSGYVLLAFLRADLVERWHWLKEGQLLDAVAVGQVTPGPLFTTATFIGYLLGGFAGAMVASSVMGSL